MNITNTAVDNAGDDAIHIDAINASLFAMKFNGGSLVNAGGDMTESNTAGGSISVINMIRLLLEPTRTVCVSMPSPVLAKISSSATPTCHWPATRSARTVSWASWIMRRPST